MIEETTVATVIDTVTEWYLRISNELSDEKGQGLVEYALIIAVVGVMLVAALIGLRGGIQNTFNNIQTTLNTGS